MKIEAYAMIVIILMISQTMSAPQGFGRFAGSFSASRGASLNRALPRRTLGFGRRFRRAIYTHLKMYENFGIFQK